MRPYGTHEQLQKRLQRAFALLRQGKAVETVAERVGVTTRSIYRWNQERQRAKKKKHQSPGKPTYLSREQIRRLEQELLRGAYAHGYSEDYWTLDRIGRVIWDLFKTRYTLSGVWRLLDRMNWSWQKVQRLAIQRDDETVANWKHRVWPRIKKVAETAGDARVCR